jgi:hypothetical protein
VGYSAPIKGPQHRIWIMAYVIGRRNTPRAVLQHVTENGTTYVAQCLSSMHVNTNACV